MIKRSLRLALILLLAAPSALPAAEVEVKVAQPGSPRLSAQAAALPQLPGALTAPAGLDYALKALAGGPQAVRALAVRTTPAAAVAAALAAQPALIGDPAVRAQAVAAVGPQGAAKLESAAAALAERAAREPELARAVETVRSATSQVSPEKARAALSRIIKELGVMKLESAAGTGDAVAAAGPSVHPSPLSKPTRRMSGLRRALSSAVIAATLAVAPAAAHAQSAQPGLHLPNPVVAMAQAGARQQSAEVVHARDIGDAIAKWQPGVKVIVVGDVTIDAGTIQSIADGLKDKTWTVVIVADASGHVYRDAEGRTHYDLDAVDYGTGQGLYNKGGFGDAKNAQTGERAGVILTLVMNQHKLFLHGSEAMRAHGLDTDTGRPFKGDLDQWAISHMRNGGDVQGAVSETVSNIDALLAQSIAADNANGKTAVADAKSAVEQLAGAQAAFSSKHAAAASAVAAADVAAMRRSVAEGERLLAAGKPRQAGQAVRQTLSQAQSALSRIQNFDAAYADGGGKLAAASAEVETLDRAAAAFRAKHDKAAGDLARPATAQMRERLAAARKSLETDPQAAVTAAAEVTAQARALSQSLAELPGAADEIAAAQKLHDQLDGKLRAGEAHESLVAARQALRQAADDVKNGNSAWKGNLEQAKTQLSSAEQTIAAADAAARTKLILFWLLNGLLALVTLGGSIFLNRRAARAGAKAEAELKKWDDILEKKLDAIIDELDKRMDVYVGAVEGPKSRGWTGQTADLTAQIRRDSGYSKLLLAKARQVHDEATALVRPKALTWKWAVNMFWPSNYAKAESLLANEPITFKPEDSLDEIFGREGQDWRGDLYGDAKHYEAFSKTFTELMAEFNGRSKAAVDSLDKLEHAVTKSGEVMDAVDAKVAQAAAKKDSLADADGLFAASKLFTDTLPAVTKMTAAARETAKTDPIQGVYGGGAEADRIVSDASALVQAITEERAASLKTADESAAALTKLAIGTDWIAAEKTRLSGVADGIAAAAAKSAVSDKIAALKDGIDTLGHRASDALKGANALAEARKAIAAQTEAVAAARAQLAKGLDLPADKMMTEPDLDPSDYLAAATKAADKTAALLSQGKLDEAKASYDDLQKNLGKAKGITDASLDSLKNHSATEQARFSENERLKALVPQRQKVLDSIVKDFAPSVLALTAGDATHPNANGTVSDNIDEADAAIDAAVSKRAKALEAFRAGAVLKAADLLSQSLAHEQIAQFRLDEITEKRTRLDQTVAANASTRQTLEARVKDYESKVVDDKRTMNGTLKEFAASKVTLGEAIKRIEAPKPDPFQAAAALVAATSALDHVWVSARNDFDQFAELGRALSAARAQLDEAGRQASGAKGDGVADSPAITQSYGDIARLESAYSSAVNASQRPHGDWPTLDREAGRIGNEAAHVAATLKNELAAAARATDAINSASSQVRQATNWTGGYGVYIPGSPGSGSLDSARSALNRGDYSGAVSYAESARREAANAIAVAEAEVMRRRREEEERQRREEEERRRRQQEEEDRRRASDSGSSYGGGGGGGSSWGGSSSGNSSSGW